MDTFLKIESFKIFFRFTQPRWIMKAHLIQPVTFAHFNANLNYAIEPFLAHRSCTPIWSLCTKTKQLTTNGNERHIAIKSIHSSCVNYATFDFKINAT